NTISIEGGACAVRIAGLARPRGLEGDVDEGVRMAEIVHTLTGVHPRHWRPLARSIAERYLCEQWAVVERMARALRDERMLTIERAIKLTGPLPRPDTSELWIVLSYWTQHARAR